MTDSVQAHKDEMQFLSQARAMRSALVSRQYCTDVLLWVGVLSTINCELGDVSASLLPAQLRRAFRPPLYLFLEVLLLAHLCLEIAQ